jgi:hypothetical protein
MSLLIVKSFKIQTIHDPPLVLIAFSNAIAVFTIEADVVTSVIASDGDTIGETVGNPVAVAVTVGDIIGAIEAVAFGVTVTVGEGIGVVRHPADRAKIRTNTNNNAVTLICFFIVFSS